MSSCRLRECGTSSGCDFQAFPFGFLSSFDDPSHAGRVAGERLFHKYIHAFPNRVLQLGRPETGIARDHGDVSRARTQAVDGVLEGIESYELTFPGHIHAVGEAFLQSRGAPLADPRKGQPGHELDAPIGEPTIALATAPLPRRRTRSSQLNCVTLRP